MLTQRRSMRKPSGGVRRPHSSKKLATKGSQPSNTKAASGNKVRAVRARTGGVKRKLLYASTANVYDATAKKHSVVKIITVNDNAANRFFTRTNTLTKGAVVETEIGTARVTSRPGQHGVVNAVLVGKAK